MKKVVLSALVFASFSFASMAQGVVEEKTTCTKDSTETVQTISVSVAEPVEEAVVAVPAEEVVEVAVEAAE